MSSKATIWVIVAIVVIGLIIWAVSRSSGAPVENAMTNEGQISYVKAYHRLGGWFPREAKDPASVR